MSRNTLVLNCATAPSALAIYQEGEMALERSWGNLRRSGEVLGDYLAAMLAELELTLPELNRVILAHGPGSFTGLRVGLAFLKGLFYTEENETPVEYTGVSTLDTLARNVTAPVADIYPCVYYRRDAVFTAAYRKRDSIVQRTAEPFVLKADDLGRLPDAAYLVGEFAGVLPEVDARLDSCRFNLLPAPQPGLSLAWLHHLGCEEIARHGSRDLAAAEPLYLAEFKPTLSQGDKA